MKYPRTPHLPWSPGGTDDDKRLADASHFLNKKVLITEKMDGSNVCMTRHACFARSHSGPPTHASFDAFKAFHAERKHLIPEGTQIFGEWLYAEHSISYQALPSYFMMFGVLHNETVWASWEEVLLWAEELGVQTVPVLAVKTYETEKDLRAETERLTALPSLCGGDREGVVVRLAQCYRDFAKSVAKWVRKDHVQTTEHWKNQVIKRNGLI